MDISLTQDSSGFQGFEAAEGYAIVLAEKNNLTLIDDDEWIDIEDDNPSFSRTIVVTKNHRFHESFPTTLGFGKSKARIFSTSMVSISFEVPYSWSADGSLDDDAQRIRMEVFDLRGRKIATLVDRNLRPGSYDANWRGKSYSGRQVAAGMYAITLSNKQSRDVMKIVKK